MRPDTSRPDDPFTDTPSADGPASTQIQSSLHPEAVPHGNTRSFPDGPTDSWRPPAAGTDAWQSLGPPAVTPDRTQVGSGDPALFEDAPLPPGFAFEQELGRGGMGVVYLARQTALNRRVAIKMMLAGEYATAGQTARFVGEAEAIARIQHPNVVQVFEIGRHAGRAYFSLEFCTGGTLAQKLAGTPLAPREAAAAAAAVAAGVQAAHDAGVIHRDLKPQNVLLQPDPTAAPGAGSGPSLRLGGLIPKVTDFGLAKQVDGENLTQTGAVMGTPSYMAPEQARGDTRAMGPRTDVWAVGTILYECLTGRPPFKAASAMDTMEQVIRDEPVPPRRLVPGVPADLETICLKCLRKHPSERYATAAAVADDLNRFLTGRPVTARPLSVVSRSVRWVKRNPLPTALLAAVLTAVGIGAAGIWLYAKSERAEADRLRVQNDQLVRGREDRDKFTAARAEAQRVRTPEAYARALTAADAPGAASADEVAAVRAEAAAVDAERQRDAERAAAARRRTEFLALRDEALFKALADKAVPPGTTDRTAAGAAAAALRLFGLAAPLDPAAAARLASDYPPKEREELEDGVFELLDLLSDDAVRVAVPLLPAGGRPVPRAVAGRLAAIPPDGESDHPVDLFDRCRKAFSANDMPGTATAARRLLGVRSNHLWGLYLSAVARLRQGQYVQAASGFDACLAQRPGFHNARVQRGYALTMAKDTDGAADFAAVLAAPDASDFDRFLALNNRGLTYTLGKQWGPAEADLTAAAALRPDIYSPLRILVRVRLERGDKDAAAATVADMLRRFPKQPELHRDAAAVHLARGDRKAARAALEAAVALDPDHAAEDWVLLADLARADDRLADGLAAADRAVALDPKDTAAHRARGELLLALDRPADADAALHRMAELAGPDKMTSHDHQVRGLAREQLRQFPAAVESYTLAAADGTDKERRDARLRRGRLYLLMDAPRPAAADFDAVLAELPAEFDARVGRAEARVRLGRYADALADLAAARPAAARQQYLAARVHALLYQRLDADPKRRAEQGLSVNASLDAFKAAVARLEAAVKGTSAADRAGFWAGTVARDPALVPLLDTPALKGVAALARPAD